MKAREVVKEHKTTHKKTIILAFASGVSQGLSTEVILNFQRENPEIPFKIKEWSKQKCIDKLSKGDADLALLVNPFDLSLFHTTRLTEGYMYIAIHKNHPLSIYDDIDFSLLDQQTIITGSEDNALRELFDHYCQLLRIEPNIMFSSSYSLDIINSGHEPNVMATVTPIMTSKITNPDFKVHRLLTPEPGYLYSCMNKSQKPSKDLLAVSDYIKDYFSKIKVIKLPD
jgi:DNA-binding transcriptional LysR family regulator